MEFRPYQKEAIDSIFSFCRHNPKQNPLVVLPTGTGKSVVISGFIQARLKQKTTAKILLICHQKELLEQDAIALHKQLPDVSQSFFCAGLGQKSFAGQVVFGSVQTLSNEPELPEFDCILIDEAHLVPFNATTRYGQVLNKAHEANPNARVIGLTATPYRLDKGHLCMGEPRIFNDVSYNANIRFLTDQGFLTRLTTKATETKFDVSDVKKRGGEFVSSELEAVFNILDRNNAAVNEIIERGHDRKSWLVFCVGIAHAENITEKFIEKGIDAKCLTGETPHATRAEMLRDFKSGKIRCLVNVEVLTTGFDAACVDLVAVLRATQSPGLWVQVLGRGTRVLVPDAYWQAQTPDERKAFIANGEKPNCLILDFGGNAKRFGPLDYIGQALDAQKPPEVVTCPDCKEQFEKALGACPECGFQVPKSLKEQFEAGLSDTDPSLEQTPSDVDLYEIRPPEWFNVTYVVYSKHQKAGKPTSLKVEYVLEGCDLPQREWVCLGHDGYAREKAVTWWKKRTTEPVPDGVNDEIVELADYALTKPRAIEISQDPKNPKWPFVSGFEMDSPTDAWGLPSDKPEDLSQEQEPATFFDLEDEIPF